MQRDILVIFVLIPASGLGGVCVLHPGVVPAGGVGGHSVPARTGSRLPRGVRYHVCARERDASGRDGFDSADFAHADTICNSDTKDIFHNGGAAASVHRTCMRDP